MSDYDQPPFTMNDSQPDSFNSSNMTSESFDSPTDMSTIQSITQHQESSQGNMINTSDTSCDFSIFDQVETQQHQILRYLKFYHFSPDDNNFYYVTCKIILKDADDHDHYNHGFFFQHPDDHSTVYYVTCKLLPYHLIENILNNGMGFDVKCEVLLSLQQKLNLEQNLKQKLCNLMSVSMVDIQNYNDSNDSNDSSSQNGFGDYTYETNPQQQ
ncbi:hypothetical protein C1645_864602 [Glomus cerebriforme]|uniref:Uncharacterized protein n=1 Tax=Glomus cerebriforme TaxID=658196 RepID=A0A397S9T8_9GLOM|nr:hypothetical protein C1645_864602 [Glomus cerebriforme]